MRTSQRRLLLATSSSLFLLTALPHLGAQTTSAGPAGPANSIGPSVPTPSLTTLPVALARSFARGGESLQLLLSEADNGPADLNGDGDILDDVFASFDPASGVLTVSPVDAWQLTPGDGYAGLIRRESDSGQDWNGDGLLDDDVLQILRTADGSLTNTMVDVLGTGTAVDSLLAVRSGSLGSPRFPIVVYDDASGTTVASDLSGLGGTPGPDQVAVVAFEPDTGRDLNGDGDQSDFVLAVYRPSLGASVSSGQVAEEVLGYAGSLVVFATYELDANVDFDGDGSFDDLAIRTFDADTGVTDLLAVEPATVRSQALLADQRLIVRQSESLAGDLNGDGDTDDAALIAVDLAQGTTSNLGLDGFPRALHGANALVYLDEDVDRNGDGDLFDQVPAVWDTQSGSLWSSGVAAGVALQGGIGPTHAAYTLSENQQGGQDLNGDGDAFDTLFEVRDLIRGQTTRFPLDVDGTFLTPTYSDFAHGFLVEVYEQTNAADLNGDGDTSDVVVHVFEFAANRLTNLRRSSFGDATLFGRQLAITGYELYDQVDFTGDGDEEDRVVHVGRLR